MAFNDGEPLDAAKLGKLEQDISILNSTLPTIGASSTNITVANQTVKLPVIPQVQGGNAGSKTLQAGYNEWPITFESPLNGTPKAVIIQTRSADGVKKKWHPQVDVKTKSTTASGCTLTCFMPSGSGAPMTIYVSYVAVVHP